MIRRASLLFVWATCAPPRPPPRLADAPAELPADQLRRYTIWLGGARVGTAIETETWSRAGVVLRRDEALRFVRGDVELAIATTIVIDADAALVPLRVRWSERGGRDEHRADAIRGPAGWQISTAARVPADAIPAELVPLLVRRDGHFAGAVFLPARGFVAGHGRIEPIAPGRLVARVALERADVEATIDLDRDGAPARVVDGDGVIAIRATAAQVAAPFPAVDLIAATSIAITSTSTRAHVRGSAPRIALEGDLALPAVPGQRARPTATGVEVELDPALPGALPSGPDGADRRAEIAHLVTAVRARIVPDLATTPSAARDAAAATAGDCTTFALAYAGLATARAIPTRVITGLRVDGDRLVRHRWAASWTGRAWIAVDAAFGAVPAGGDLVGLAVHDADDAGLVAGEAALTRVRAAAWN